jgi:GTP-binding protein
MILSRIAKSNSILAHARSSVRLMKHVCAPSASIASRFMSAKAYDPTMVRNVAIIAHVDHGKTTLMDNLLEKCGTTVTTERAMDSNEHEKERGITIMSKYTRLHYGNHTLHVVDTPGHADFGGEVERILSMVDGVVLLVDASEGPMSQTKFVLSKALNAGKKAIVVFNKVDREGHRAEELETEIFDLFCALSDNESLLDYPILYASARQGWASHTIKAGEREKLGVIPLLDTIIKHIPPAVSKEQKDEKLKRSFGLSVNTINSDNHLGRIVTGKVEHGSIRIGDKIKVLNAKGDQQGVESRVTKLFYLEGLTRVDVEEAHAGQIVSLAGCSANVSETVCAPEATSPIPTIPISPPVISMTFGPNDSPLSGRDGNKLTSNMIKDRLYKEVENNVTLQLSPASDSESINVNGRGELQIGILVETMRREGFELTVSPPNVISTKDEQGKNVEPYEEVVVDIDPELQGMVIDQMSNRKGNLIEFKDIGARARLIFHAPSRGLIGFRHDIMSATRGNATVNSAFSHYGVVNVQEFSGLQKGKLVSTETGKTTGYALMMVEERGQLFVGVGEETYVGMVVGECARSASELDVNPCRLKKLTNVRSTGAEEKVNLTPPKKMTTEEFIAYMDEDEVLEVTPTALRLRKKILDPTTRARVNKSKKLVK